MEDGIEDGDVTQGRREVQSPVTARVRRNLGISGTIYEPPKDDSTLHPADDDYGFLAAVSTRSVVTITE